MKTTRRDLLKKNVTGSWIDSKFYPAGGLALGDPN